MKELYSARYDIQTKGFSLGGAIATYAGIANDCVVRTLCPAPLSPKCQEDLGDEKMQDSVTNHRIVNMSVRRDIVTDQTALARIGNALERTCGRRIPHIVGPGYRVMEHEANNKGNLFRAHNCSSEIWNIFATPQPGGDQI